MFYPGDWVFLDTTNIKTTHLSPKLLYCCLGLFIVEQQVEPLVYHLKLPYTMKKLYSMFNIVKLSTTPRPRPLLPPVIIDGEEE